MTCLEHHRGFSVLRCGCFGRVHFETSPSAAPKPFFVDVFRRSHTLSPAVSSQRIGSGLPPTVPLHAIDRTSPIGRAAAAAASVWTAEVPQPAGRWKPGSVHVPPPEQPSASPLQAQQQPQVYPTLHLHSPREFCGRRGNGFAPFPDFLYKTLHSSLISCGLAGLASDQGPGLDGRRWGGQWGNRRRGYPTVSAKGTIAWRPLATWATCTRFVTAGRRLAGSGPAAL